MTAIEERFLFTVDGLQLGVLEFRVTEELSLPFLADISLVSRSDLDFDEIIGKKACLTIVGENEDRYVHGQVIQLAHTGATGKHNIYNLQLVPSMWLLSLQTDCRIFQQKTVPEIITQLLEESNITSDQFEMRLKSDYAPREYCVQYRESDLDFLSRMLEERDSSGRGTEYNNHFTVVPASTHFRTPRRGQKPKIFGVQTAIVVGPAEARKAKKRAIGEELVDASG